MKSQTMHQMVPALIMAGAAAVPVATTVEILTHVAGAGRAIALQPSAPVAVALPNRVNSPAGGVTPAAAGATRTFQGPVVADPFGGVQATITVSGRKISTVSISAPQDNPASAGINQQAVPLLQRETLQAQSARINTVSGATYTSQAYAQSLQAAIAQAQRQGNLVAAGPSSSLAGNSKSGSAGQTLGASVSVDD